jgi:hypothetical protein
MSVTSFYKRTRKIQPQDIHPAIAGLRSFEFGFALFEAFDTSVSAASQNTNQFSKSSQSIVKFSAVQSIESGRFVTSCRIQSGAGSPHSEDCLAIIRKLKIRTRILAACKKFQNFFD